MPSRQETAAEVHGAQLEYSLLRVVHLANVAQGGIQPIRNQRCVQQVHEEWQGAWQGFAGGRKAQRAELGGSCKGSWAGQGGNTQIEAQCIPTSHGRNIADANALPGVLHAIAQRRPRAQFRAGDDTAELAILRSISSWRFRSGQDRVIGFH